MEKYQIEDMMTNLQSYLEANGINTSRLFRCLNPDHSDSNASMKYFDDYKVYCFGCGASYNLIDCISVIENLDHKEAFKKAINTYCLNLPSKIVKRPLKEPKQAEKPMNSKDYSKAFKVWQENYKNSLKAKEYLKNRGIDEKVAERFKLGFNTFNFGDFSFDAIIIPISKTCFTARNLLNTNKIRYYKPKGCHTELFNLNALKNDIPYCVITEGEFDCLSFETIGINAIALCSVNNTSKFVNMQKPLKTYILALDNDDAGKKTTEELISYFEENKLPYVVFNNCDYKDANLALISDRNKFENQIQTICTDIINEEKRKNRLHNAEM